MAQTRDVNANLSGQMIKEFDMCCMVCTIIWGSFFIFPLCFMCCDWWKKAVYPAYDIPLSTYQSLGNLLRSPAVANLSLTVMDNRFDNVKAQALFQIVQGSGLRSMTFINMVGDYDVYNHEYSQFENNMRPFKKLGIATDIRWAFKIVH